MIKVIDDFLTDPALSLVMHQAREAEYKTHPFSGYEYHGINADHLDHPIVNDVAKELVKELGMFELVPSFSFSIFRAGHQPTRWIHADNACGGYASVLYLTSHKELTGTAFWDHRYLPKPGKLNFHQATADQINQGDCEVEKMWHMRRFVEAKRNRLVIYSADQFHSIYPKKGPDSRRVLVSFINQGSI